MKSAPQDLTQAAGTEAQPSGTGAKLAPSELCAELSQTSDTLLATFVSGVSADIWGKLTKITQTWATVNKNKMKVVHKLTTSTYGTWAFRI